jgi:hypothetical protein
VDKNTSKAYAGSDGPGHPAAPGSDTGPALFVINLCASVAPLANGGANIPGLENYRLYQVAKVEDGRTRHRLRLGFFASEAHAESVLTVVRQQYPTALITCLCEEDRRFTRGYVPVAAPPPRTTQAAADAAPRHSSAAKNPAAPAAASSPKADLLASLLEPAPVSKPRTAAANAGSAPRPSGGAPNGTAASAKAPAGASTGRADAATQAPRAAAKPQVVAKSQPATPTNAAAGKNAAKVDPASSMRARALDLTFSDPPRTMPEMPEKKSTGRNEPFHVGKGVQIGEVGLRLQSERPAAKLPQPAGSTGATASKVPAPGAARGPAQPPAKPRQPATNPLARSPYESHSRPDLDSTQTLRALTSAELESDQQEKWFAIQLALSEQPVNLDAMPHLDIFEAYRLYSVAIAGSGKILHSLRLGFFKEAVSAEAVGGYIKTFFASPTVQRVSVAEHARFKEPLARKPAPFKAEAKVVELSDARPTRPVVPTVTMEVPASKRDTAASGSFKAGASGSYRGLDAAPAKAGDTSASARIRTGATGKQRALPPAKTLEEQLLEEAREVELAQSGIRKLPKNDSLLSRLVGKLTK